MAKKDKMCIVCGITFQGTAKAKVCSPACRKRLERMKVKGQKPTFKLVAAQLESKKQIGVRKKVIEDLFNHGKAIIKTDNKGKQTVVNPMSKEADRVEELAKQQQPEPQEDYWTKIRHEHMDRIRKIKGL